MKIIAIDFETSGLRPGEHAPVTIGLALMDGGNVIDSEEWLLGTPTDKNGRINRAYDVVALEISGTKWTSIKRDGLPHVQVCKEMLAFTREHDALYTPVVAFNAPFDFAWYSDLLYLGGSWNQHERRFETFLPPLAGPWHCARLMAVHALPGLCDYKLDTVADACGLARSGASHCALEDAILAGKVFAHIQSLAKGQRSTEVA